MTLYRYRAVDRQGFITSGHLSGDHRDDILMKLHEQGLDVLSLRSQKRVFSFLKTNTPISRQEFFMFCLYLEHFSQVGLSFLEGLQEMQKHFQGTFQGILKKISHDITTGLLFSQALAKHPTLFDPVFISLVEVGEKTGDLAHIFQKLTQYVKQNQETNTHINQALRYPLLVGLILLGSILGIFVFLVPALLEFLLTLDMPLSFATKSLLLVASFFPWGALAVLTGNLLLFFLLSTTITYSLSFRLIVHTALLKVPVVGKLWTQTTLSCVFYALSIMVGQGVDILQGLTVVQHSMRQEKLLADFRRVRDNVQSGINLSQALARSPFFAGPFSKMIQIGEETGRLSEVLNQISHLYRKESQERLEFLISLLEPICLSILGLLLGWIIMATFVPLYESFHIAQDAY